jgi:hypothetical protein
VSIYNPGPSSTATINQTAALTAAAPAGQPIYTYATLPPASSVAPGTQAYTSDQLTVVSNGKSWVATGSSLISTVKASVAASAASNSVINQPLIAPAAWVGSTAYQTGQSVTNNGNAYVCSVAGTSAVSGGPTGVGTAPQTDNTVTWQYWGPTWTSSALAPTVTVTATRYSTGIYYGNTANTNSLGATNIKDSTNFTLSPGNDGGGIGNSYLWTSGILGTAQFVTDAPALQIVVQATTNPGLCVYVGSPGSVLSPVALGIIAPNPSGYNYYQLVFADRRPRQFLVEMPSGISSNGIQTFYGVICNDTVSKVSAPNKAAFTMGLVGTSYFTGNQTLSATAALGIAPQIAKLMGCTTYWIDEKGGGTGYVTPNISSIFGSPSRIAALAAQNPNVVVYSGAGINDYTYSAIANVTGGASGANALAIEQAAALACYQACRAALPNALILVIGSEAGSTGPSAAVFNMELAVSNAVAQFNDPYCIYIAQSAATAPKAFISGTGTVAATNGTGNSDVYVASDGIHTVQDGSNYLAQRSVNAIRQIINGLT